MGAESLPEIAAIESAPDQRSARRVALLLRAGKLICQHGEYLCILRDASTGGVRARLFHDLPQTSRFALELLNGERFAVELVWQQDGHAGFRFVDQKIDVRQLIEDNANFPRRSIRLQLTLPVTIEDGTRTQTAVLCNLSQNGAQVEIDSPLAVGQQIAIVIGRLPERTARVRWRRRNAHGLIFQKGFRLDELAELAARLQQDAVGMN